MAAIALVALLGVAGSEAEAGIYRWTDAQGRLHFTQDLSRVPPAQRARAAQQAAARSSHPSRLQIFPRAPSIPPAQRRSVDRSVLRIPFQRQGSAMLVQVRINDLVTAPFLVDTGASDVALPADLAAAAGVISHPDTPREVYETANGRVSQPVVTLDSVEAGTARVEGVRASISPRLRVGLLGGSFFNNFTVQIDPGAQVLSLVPNEHMRSGRSEEQWRQRFRELQRRIARLDQTLGASHFARQNRTLELERHRRSLQRALEALEREADAAGVPHAWRE